MSKSLAVKYRPRSFDDLTEQSAIVAILSNQVATNTFKHTYMFVGPAGCGKTTSARILASMIDPNGEVIEIDAASHGNVDDIRELVTQARSKPIVGNYKIFIIDECHCLSSAGWSATLKLIEEPPVTAIFIFCTTDVQKVPKTIMSRCQRFDFHRISYDGIVNRLKTVVNEEYADCDIDNSVYEYIAKLADGGMRDALTLLDKCIDYSHTLTLPDVVKILGTVDYDVMFDLTDGYAYNREDIVIDVVESLYNDGKDLKQFLKSYIQFLLDLRKLWLGCDIKYVQIPRTYDTKLRQLDIDPDILMQLLNDMVQLNADIKYSTVLDMI